LKFTPQLSYFLVVLSALVLTPTSALALEFRSVAEHKTVLYDAPSASAKKTLIVGQNYPLEVIVDLGDWFKVRDAQGAINWIEVKNLSNKRTVMVSASRAELRAEPNATSQVLATLEKDVVLEIVDDKLTNSWLKVKHRDGAQGFVSVSSVWGY
jgi:SH3-like domain-containing protein